MSGMQTDANRCKQMQCETMCSMSFGIEEAQNQGWAEREREEGRTQAEATARDCLIV